MSLMIRRPIDTLRLLLSNSQYPYNYLEIAHHRVSGSNIYFIEGNKKGDTDKIKCSNQSDLIDALLFVEIGDFSASESALTSLRASYLNKNKNDSFILFSNAVINKINSNPFFYVCVSKHSSDDEWILNFSFNSNKPPAFVNHPLTCDLELSLNKAREIIEES